jgi:hypothetical protein
MKILNENPFPLHKFLMSENFNDLISVKFQVNFDESLNIFEIHAYGCIKKPSSNIEVTGECGYVEQTVNGDIFNRLPFGYSHKIIIYGYKFINCRLIGLQSFDNILFEFDNCDFISCELIDMITSIKNSTIYSSTLSYGNFPDPRKDISDLDIITLIPKEILKNLS